MRICGISIEGKNANIVVLDSSENKFELFDTGIPKITLNDASLQEDIHSFYKVFESFIKENKIELIGIKRRQHTGTYAGGAMGFKIETIIQMIDVRVVLIAPITISKTSKKLEKNTSIFKYQIEAYKTAYTTLIKYA